MGGFVGVRYCEQSRPRDSERPRSMRKKDRNVRVLIVEDEVLLAMHIEDLVREMGFEVVGPVGRTDEAIDLIKSDDISVALLDVRLRQSETVYPAADLLRIKGIPFILTTAYGSESIDPRYAEDPVVKKPFTLRELESKLRTVLKQH